MFKTDITYEGFDGQVTETAYFNLTKSEFLNMAANNDPFIIKLKQFGKKKNRTIQDVYFMIKDLVAVSYGVRDGNKFSKSEEISKDFIESLAFDSFVWEMLGNENENLIIDFMSGILPAEYRAMYVEEVRKEFEAAKKNA